jgi:hypothetical protein
MLDNYESFFDSFVLSDKFKFEKQYTCKNTNETSLTHGNINIEMTQYIENEVS